MSSGLAAATLTVGAAALAHRAAGCPGADPELAVDLDAAARADLAALPFEPGGPDLPCEPGW